MSVSPAPSVLRRAVRATVRLTVTGLFLGAAGAAVLGGRGILADRAEAVPMPDPAAVTPVAVARIALRDSHVVQRRFSGQVEAAQQTDLAFERAGTLAQVLVAEGDRVTHGQVIARLDIRLLQAERAQLEASRQALEAQVELARRTNDRQVELRERGFATAQRVDDTSLTLTQLQARIAEVDAALMAVDVNLAKSELTAPFAGRVGTRMLDTGAVTGPGTPVVSLLDGAAPRFRAGLDPVLAATLTVGAPVTVQLAGGKRTAKVAQIAPDLDTVTRAQTIYFDLDGATPPARATGEVILDTRVRVPGAWVPLSALRPGPRGTWTLMTVTDGVAGIEAAEILHLDGERAFVRGTFADGMAYIPGGTHRIVPDQRVLAQGETPWAR